MPRNDSERREQVSTILCSAGYRKVYIIHLKKSRFVEGLSFFPKNEVIAFPKIELLWDWVGDVYVYIKSDAAIWFWKYRHVKYWNVKSK